MSLAEDRAQALPGTRPPGDRARRDGTSWLRVYATVLVLLPAGLVFAGAPIAVTPAMLIGYLSLLWWFIARLSPEATPNRGFQPIRLSMLLFWASLSLSFVAAFISAPASGAVGHAADRNLITIIASIGVAIFAADSIDSWERLSSFLSYLVTLVGIMAFIGILQFTAGINIASWFKIPGLRPAQELNFSLDRSDFVRPAATATHPIEFGVVLATVACIAIHFALIARPGWPRTRAWILASMILLASLMSLSRSAIFGLFLGLPVLFFAWPRQRQVRAAMLLPVFLAATRVAIPGLVGTLVALFTHFGTDPSIKGRTDDYPHAIADWSTSKMFGHGFGTGTLLLDNQYLGSFIDTGIFGVTVLVLIFVIAVFTGRGARWRTLDPVNKDLCQALVAAIVVLMASYVTFDALAFPMVTGLTFLLMGCCGAAWRLALADQREAGTHPVAEGWALR